MRGPKISIFAVLIMLIASIPGCIFDPLEFDKCEDEDNCLTIAFETKEEYRNSDENPQKLADRLEEIMDVPTEVMKLVSQLPLLREIFHIAPVQKSP